MFLHFKTSKTCVFFNILFSISLLTCCFESFATNKKVTFITVSGIEFTNIIEYPDKGLNAEFLNKKMMLKRSGYPHKMTMEELNSVADSMTELYREKGFKFHTVYVPLQIPKNGLIYFNVTEAILGDIQVIGKNIDKGAVKNVFNKFLKKPLYQPDIDDAVLALKSQSGIDAVAYYSRGVKSGEIRLNIKVQQKKWDAYAQFDNYGSLSTGEHRLTTSVNWYSPTARLDQLSVGVMAANGDPDTNFFGYLNYRMPLWNLDNQLSFNLSNNVFSIGQDFANLDLEGDARIAQLKFDHQLSRSWTGEQKLSLLMAYKTTDYDSIFKDPTLERDESSESIALEWSIDKQSENSSFQQQWLFSAMGGRYEVDGVTQEKEDFSKFNVFANFRQFFGSRENRWSNLISFSVRGQFSDTALPSFEKFLLTGPYGVRSYQPGFFASDRGGFLSVDWYFTRLFQFNSSSSSASNSNLSSNLKSSRTSFSIIPLVFIDAAYGEKLTMDSTMFDRTSISGAGVGLEISIGNNWSARVFSSKEISQKTDSGLEFDTMDFYLQINYRTE